MDPVKMESLLTAEEERIRNELSADALIDKDREKSVERLTDSFNRMLLRYNAACRDDPVRQSAADCQAAVLRETFPFLLAGTARKEIRKRPLQAGALVFLLLSVICCLTVALIIRRLFTAGCILLGLAAVFAFISGRLWYGEREVRVQAGLDGDLVWNTLKRVSQTMDRKIDAFCEQAELWTNEPDSSASGGNAQMDPEELKLFADLLEALYAENGDYALRQLKKVSSYLQQHGVRLQDYTEETSELFEILPTKKESGTQRPALLSGGTLLLAGKATEHIV